MIRAQDFEDRDWREHDELVSADFAAWARRDRLEDFTPAADLVRGGEMVTLAPFSLDAAGEGAPSNPPHTFTVLTPGRRRDDGLDGARGMVAGALIAPLIWAPLVALVWWLA